MSHLSKYVGTRTEAGCRVEVVAFDGTVSDLPLRLDLFNHSPTGFEWGYSGSGPAQLALALLAHALEDDDRAFQHHQRFKFKHVASFDAERWSMSSPRIRLIVDDERPPEPR